MIAKNHLRLKYKLSEPLTGDRVKSKSHLVNYYANKDSNEFNQFLEAQMNKKKETEPKISTIVTATDQEKKVKYNF